MLSTLSFLKELFDTAVAAAQPGSSVTQHLPPPGSGRTVVVGAGKAAAVMGMAVEAAWPEEVPLEGVLVGPETAPPLRRLQWIRGCHPVPGEESQTGGQALLRAAQGLTAHDQVIALWSGGASALACLPIPELTLRDKQHLTQVLLASGATIHEINGVRKHLSLIKGGRLAAACAPAKVLSLVVSDIPGDRLDLVGSGPTLPDPSTSADALAILDRYAVTLPAAARQALEEGRWETPKPGVPLFANHRVHLVASPQQALLAAVARAESRGWRTYLLSDALEGEARAVGGILAKLALAAGRPGSPFQPPCLLLSGGETTVRLAPGSTGQGGRASETLAACLLALQGEPGCARISGLMADTDGVDGAGPGAGAWFLRGQGGSPEALRAALEAHDTGEYFHRLGQALVTGPTGTNVNDFRVLLIDAAG